jgi:hypothetical protein
MPNTQNSQRDISRVVLPELIKAASRIVGFKLPRPEFGSAKNISGIRSKTLTFSQRHDSRTVFASDSRYGQLGRAGVWTGSDRTVVTLCRRMLRAAGVAQKEISRIQVQSEMGQVAERSSEGNFQVREPTLLRKLAFAHRAINGIPVWFSYARLGLTRQGEMGCFELHWPDLPAAAVKEAGVIRQLVKRGYKAPEVPGAKVESVEAGILHSPAIGFFMDIMPAIRVIYRGDDPTIGRKPVLYLDRHGDPITMPRDIEPAKPPSVERTKPRSQATGR